MIYKIGVRGTTPLIQDNGQTFTRAQASGKKKSRGEQQESPDDIQEKVYMFNGKYAHPSQGFMNSFLRAASLGGYKIGRHGARSLLAGALTITPMPLVELHVVGKPEPYGVRCVIPATGGSIYRIRPLWNHWGADFRLDVDEMVWPSSAAKTLEEILKFSGRAVGVGCWRPEREGQFGKFDLKSELI